MSTLKELRQTLGLSQLEMANFLAVPRSVYSMTEGGKRKLPVVPSTRVANLELSLQQQPGPVYKKLIGGNEQLQRLELEKWVATQIRNTNILLNKALRKLEQMQVKAIQANTLLQATCAASIIDIPSHPQTIKQNEALRRLAIVRLDENGTIAQLKVQVQINGLEEQIRVLENLL